MTKVILYTVSAERQYYISSRYSTPVELSPYEEYVNHYNAAFRTYRDVIDMFIRRGRSELSVHGSMNEFKQTLNPKDRNILLYYSREKSCWEHAYWIYY